MLGILLAAGKGSRLEGFHQEIPNKSLLPLHGSCLMDYNIKLMAAAGVDRVIVVVGYQYQNIIDHLKQCFPDLPVSYILQNPLRGIADAIRCCLPFMENTPFLMGLADEILFAPNLERMKAQLSNSHLSGICGVVKAAPQQIQRAYTMSLNENMEILHIIEKPKPDEIFNDFCGTGYCLICPELAKMVLSTPLNQLRGEYEMADWFMTGLGQGLRMAAVEIAEKAVNINTKEDYAKAEALLKGDVLP